MNRGDRREERIVPDHTDHGLRLMTMGELCQKATFPDSAFFPKPNIVT